MADAACVAVPLPPAPAVDADDVGARIRIRAPGDVVAVVWPADGARSVSKRMKPGDVQDVGLYRITALLDGGYQADGPAGATMTDASLSRLAGWITTDARRWGAA